MKFSWVNKNKNNNLIIFFNGWGMDETIVENLKCENNDVILFYDYNSLEHDENVWEVINNSNNYEQKFVVAWSMGVMISSIFAPRIENLRRSVALNGTLKPIDDNFGIAERVYNLTVKNFSDSSCKKFIQNMTAENSNQTLTVKRDFDNIKTELSSLKNYCGNMDFVFDVAIVSDFDKIISARNQINFYSNGYAKKIIKIDSPHYLFDKFESWNDIINYDK